MELTTRQKMRALLRFPVDYLRSRKRLRDHYARPRTLEENIQLAIHFGGRGYFHVMAVQKPSEITALAQAVAVLQPKIILEIGTFWGGTLLLWANLASERVISCDLKSRRVQGLLYRSFPPPSSSCTVTLLSGNSHEPAFRARVGRELRGRQVDFLFIDGDHSERGVEADYRDYHDLVRPGGIIAFHDIVEKQPFPETQVHHFWKRLKREATAEEFINDPQQCGFGIGVIRVQMSATKEDRHG